MMHFIPTKVLNFRESSQGGQNRGKRFGFSLYNELTCKQSVQCKASRSFHKRNGLSWHNKSAHGRSSVFKVPSFTSRHSRSLPVRSSTNITMVSRPSIKSSSEIELIDLDLDDTTDVVVDDIVVLDECVNTEVKVQVAVNTNIIELDGHKSRGEALEEEDDLEIEFLEEVEVNEIRIKSFLPIEYEWMEKSFLYQPLVTLSSVLNKKIRAEDDEEIQIVNQFDDSESQGDDYIVELYGDNDNEIIVDSYENPVELEEAIFLKQAHVRNLFEDDQSNKEISSNINDRTLHEMLLLESEDDLIDVDVGSMLEVSIGTTENSLEVEEDDIVVVTLDETDAVDVCVLDDSIEGRNDADSSKDDEHVEIVDLDDTLEDEKIGFPQSVSMSIKDLVNRWVEEDETVDKMPKRMPEEKVSNRLNKKRRRDLKPRGL